MDLKGTFLKKIKLQSAKAVSLSVLIFLSAIFGFIPSSFSTASAANCTISQVNLRISKNTLKIREVFSIAAEGFISADQQANCAGVTDSVASLNLVLNTNNGTTVNANPKIPLKFIDQGGNNKRFFGGQSTTLVGSFAKDESALVAYYDQTLPAGHDDKLVVGGTVQYDGGKQISLNTKNLTVVSTQNPENEHPIVDNIDLNPIGGGSGSDCATPAGGQVNKFDRSEAYSNESVGIFASYNLSASAINCTGSGSQSLVIFDFYLNNEPPISLQSKPITTNGKVTGLQAGQTGVSLSKFAPSDSTTKNTVNLTVKIRKLTETIAQAVPLGAGSASIAVDSTASPTDPTTGQPQTHQTDQNFQNVNSTTQVTTTNPDGSPKNEGCSGPVGCLTSVVVNIIASIITAVFAFVRVIIYAIVSFLIVPLLSAMLSIQTYKDSFVAVILPGWEIIRNLGNIFFVVVLIVIGLTTLFRIEGYNYKDLLVKLVIAAVLVNFSLVIAQSILAVAETAQYQFLPPNTQAIRALANVLIVDLNGTATSLEFNPNIATEDAFVKFVDPFFKLSLAIGSAIVLGAIALFLMIRIIALWILLLVSPIPYIADILPATRSYKKQWWSSFLRYAFFTPIMAFFLNLTAYMAQNQDKIRSIILPQGAQTGAVAGGYDDVFAKGFIGFFSQAATNILLLIFLIAAIQVADKFGIEGAKTFTDIANKGVKFPGVLGRAGAERALEGTSNVTGVQLDPRIWKQKFDSYQADQKKKRLEKLETQGGGLQAIQKKLGLTPRAAANNPAAFMEAFANGGAIVRAFKNTFGPAVGRPTEAGTKKELDALDKEKTELELKLKVLSGEERAKTEANLNGFKAQQNFGAVDRTEANRLIKNLDGYIPKLDQSIADYDRQIAAATTPQQKAVLEKGKAEAVKNKKILEEQRGTLQDSLSENPDQQVGFQLEKQFLNSFYFNPIIQNDPNLKVSLSGEVGRQAAQSIADELEKTLKRLKAEEQDLRAQGKIVEADDKKDLAQKIESAKTNIETELANPNSDVIKIDNAVMNGEVGQAANIDTAKIAAEAKIGTEQAEKKISDDNDNRKEAKVTGPVVATEAEKQSLRENQLKSINKRIETAQARQSKFESVATGLKSETALRLGKEVEELKKYQEKIDMDDVDQVIQAFKKAKAEGPAGKYKASALLRHLSKNGKFVKTLGELGYGGSYDELAKFRKEVLQDSLKFSDKQTDVLLSEISKYNDKNNLPAYSKLTELKSDGSIKFIEEKSYEKKVKEAVEGLSKKARAGMKVDNYGVKNAQGVFEIHPMGVQALESLKDVEGLNQIRKEMSVSTAKTIIDAKQFGNLNKDVQVAVRTAAGLVPSPSQIKNNPSARP